MTSVAGQKTLPNGAENRLLAQLAGADLARLESALVPVEMNQGKVLYEVGAQIRDVYFIDQGMISVVYTMDDGTTIELATIGIEGLAGLPVILGADHSTYRHF